MVEVASWCKILRQTLVRFKHVKTSSRRHAAQTPALASRRSPSSTRPSPALGSSSAFGRVAASDTRAGSPPRRNPPRRSAGPSDGAPGLGRKAPATAETGRSPGEEIVEDRPLLRITRTVSLSVNEPKSYFFKLSWTSKGLLVLVGRAGPRLFARLLPACVPLVVYPVLTIPRISWGSSGGVLA